MASIIHIWSCVALYVLIGWKLANVGKRNLAEICLDEIDGIDLIPEGLAAFILCAIHILWLTVWPIWIGYGMIVTIIKRRKERRKQNDD